MNKVFIYPFSYFIFEIFERNNNIKRFEIIGVIDDNKVIKNILLSKYNCKSITLKELEDKKTFDNVDGLLIYNPGFSELSTSAKDIIKKFILNEKYIFYTCELLDYINSFAYNKIEEISILKLENIKRVIKNYKLRDVSKPVILVLGLGQNCNKTSIGLNLNTFFKNKGYNPAIITGNTLGALFNCYSYPVLEFKFEESVKRFNFMLNEIERINNPDLFIITVPSGIVKHDSSHNNLFGYPAFVITSAVIPDVSILSVYAGKYEIEEIKFLQNLCYYKLNTKFNYLHIANIVCDLNLESNQFNFFPITESDTMKNLIFKHFPMYSVKDLESKEIVHEMILEELRGNVKRI